MAKQVLPIIEAMLEAADAIVEATHGKSFEQYRAERLTRLAVERAIEIISEAARSLPDDLQARHPQLEWRKIKGIGNVLRHDY